MWTYQNGTFSAPGATAQPRTSGHDQRPADAASWQTARTASTGAPAAGRQVHLAGVKRRRRTAPLTRTLCLLYLAGLAVGSIVSRFCSATVLQYARYYINASVDRFLQRQYALLFSSQFLTLLMQLALLLVTGFCVFGIGLIPAFFFVKGVGNGCFFALLYDQFGLGRGVFMQLLFFLLPQLMGFLMLLAVGLLAWKVSRGLFLGCTRRPDGRLFNSCKTLLHRCLVMSLFSALPCLLSILSAFVFAPLFL